MIVVLLFLLTTVPFFLSKRLFVFHVIKLCAALIRTTGVTPHYIESNARWYLLGKPVYNLCIWRLAIGHQAGPAPQALAQQPQVARPFFQAGQMSGLGPGTIF
jgi:hypothetical protein